MNENDLVKQAQELEEKRKAAAIAVGNFDPIKTLADSNAIKEIYDEKFGVIKYGSLTYKENKGIKAITDMEDRTTNMVFLDAEKSLSGANRLKTLKLGVLKKLLGCLFL